MSDVVEPTVSESLTATESAPRKRRSLIDRFKSVNPNAVGSTTNVVTRSADFRRISMLPRRETWRDYSEALTEAFALPPLAPGSCPSNCPCRGTGSMKLWPTQAWALTEFYENRGGVGLLGAGSGKTLCTMLLPLLTGWQRAVLLVPAGLKRKTLNIDYPLLSRHWRLPPLEGPGSLEVIAYEKLSRDYEDYLATIKVPDAIIADEAHKLSRRGSGRSKKLERLFKLLPNIEFVPLSGTFVHRSVTNYGHLFNHALKDKSPVPHSFMELQTWAYALDEDVPDFARPKAGALLDFCRTGETVRDGFRRRILETPGIVSSSELSTGISLNVFEVKAPKPPKCVLEAFQRLRNTGCTPDGEVATTKLNQVRHAREMFLGGYLRWIWPDNKPDIEWLKKRRAWRKYVRKMTSRTHGGRWYDTEAQVALAVRKGELICSEDEHGVTGNIVRADVDVYAEWVEIRDDRKAKWGGKEPPKEWVWLKDDLTIPGAVDCSDGYMVHALEAWAREHTGIVWIENIAFLEHMRSRGWRCFGAGEDDIELEDGKTSVFSSYAHSVGKNLQMFAEMCFSNPLQNGRANEQAIAREHRPGQKADEVNVFLFLGCRETWWSWERSRLDARYIESTLGQPQRLNKANISTTTEEEVAQRFNAGEPLWADTGHAKIDGKLSDKFGGVSATPLLTEMRRRAKKGVMTDVDVVTGLPYSEMEDDDEGVLDESDNEESGE